MPLIAQPSARLEAEDTLPPFFIIVATDAGAIPPPRTGTIGPVGLTTGLLPPIGGLPPVPGAGNGAGPRGAGAPVTVGLTGVFVAILTIFYIKTEPTCGALTAIWLWMMYVAIRYLHFLSTKNELPFNLNWFFGIQHVVCWIGQFIGHGAFEHRSPALMDNLLLVFNAPFFVTAELLKACGWKANEFELIDRTIEERIKEYRRKKA